MGVGFFAPRDGGFMDTPHLMVAAFALGVTAAKMFRLATRGDDTDAPRRDGLEAGLLLVIVAAILEQALGGTRAHLLPLQYLVIALLAAHTDLVVSLVCAALAASLAVAPAATAGTLGERGMLLGAHTAALFAFALAVGSFLRLERRARLDATRRLARFQGDTDALADETEDVADLAAAVSLTSRDREKRVRELKNELDASLHRALLAGRGALGAHTVLYLRHDPDRDRLEVADVATDSDNVIEAPIDARGGVFAGAIKSRQPVTLGDVRGAPVPYYSRDEGVQSLVVAPIVRGNWVSGLLVADHLEADRFGKAQAEVLASLGSLVADLEHAGKERERHAKFQDKLRHLVEVSKVLQETLSPEDLAKRTLTISRNLAVFDFAIVAIAANAEGERFTIQTATGVDQGRLEGKDAPTTDTLVGWVLRNRVYLKAEHFRSRTTKTPLLGRRLDPDGLRAAMIFPMLRGDAVMGVCVFGSLTRDTFSDDEFEMLESVVRQTSLAMANAVLHAQTVEMATTDGLTGLANRRFLNETLIREVDRGQRQASRFAIAIVDIDHFKKVNDGYGHPMGDEVLRRVGKILRTTIQRKTDLVARYGGEEFVLVLADTDAAGARAVVDRVRGLVGKEEFEFEGRSFKVTMSAGVAAFPDDVGLPAASSAEDVRTMLVEHADRALYHSKETGRNRSTLWSAIGPAEALQPAADRSS